jgi:predicted nucleic acid-binding protein
MTSPLVVDCSVAAKWILPEPGRASALRLLEHYESGVISLIAPDLLLAEFASLLAKRNRRKEISGDQAARAFQLMEECALRLVDMRPRIRGALHLALQHQMSLWDCVYVAVAIEHDCPLVTADRRLFKNGAGRHSAIRLLE